jgi:predicted HicB family RNase H-like nuclease
MATTKTADKPAEAPAEERTKTVAVKVTPSTHRALKHIALDAEQTLQDLVGELVERVVAERNSK